MRVLLDTRIISEVRKEHPHSKVVAFINTIAPDDMFLSVISLGELIKGINLLAKGMKRTELTEWVKKLEYYYLSRILTIDHDTCRIGGDYSHSPKKRKNHPGFRWLNRSHCNATRATCNNPKHHRLQ